MAEAVVHRATFDGRHGSMKPEERRTITRGE
jgi:hypothetical protein